METGKLFFSKRRQFYPIKIKFSSFVVMLTCLLASFFFQLNTAKAQFIPCTGCTANDDHVDSVVLVQLNPAYTPTNGQPQYINLPTTCDGSTTVTGYLKIAFTQNATTRYGTSLAGNILVNGVYSSTFTYCDPAPTNSGSFVKYISSFPITYSCGTKLELKDLFIGWGNSSSNNVCPIINNQICSPSPHCEQLPLTPGGPPIVIVTPLSANFSAIGSCSSGKTAQTYSFNALDATSGTTGGTLPYSYSWKIVNKTTSVQVGTMTGANPSFDFAQAGIGTGVYTVALTVTDASTPPIVSSISKDITVISCCNLSPATVSVTSPTCSNANGTVSVTGPLGSDYVYSNNGGTYQGTTSFTVAAGTAYNITVKQLSTGCISSATNGTVNAQPATPDAPTTSVTQPTCSDATATITVTSATDNLMFSFDGGAYGAYPSTGYTTTKTGDHTITAKNEAGCMSGSATATVNAQPATPDAPTTSVTQPTCSDATATITVTSATDNLMFSFDGGAYAAYPSTGYTTTTTGDHTITAKNEAGCMSGSATATVNAQPATPDAPTTSVTQPTCSDATATITVTSATDNLMFSFDGGAYGAYPSTGYTITTTGDHTITAKNEAGCMSGSATATVNAQPATPDAPTTSVTQPTCSDATATITVTSATTGLTFSFDGGAYGAYPSTGYTTTTTGDHTITAKNEAGCMSGSATATVNAQPATPDAPTTSVTQPTCSDATATITVTSATDNLMFSFDGGAYGAYPSTGYTITTTGDHTITAKNEAGCMSGNATATVNAQPATPDAPTTSVTQPTCSDATATITVTSATDNLMFSFDGGAYAAYPSTGYTTTTTGDHTITAKNEAGCMSGNATATVNAQPATPDAPTTSVTQPTCSDATATITVTSATDNLMFSFDGGAYGAYPSTGYTTTTTGDHTITAKNEAGCISGSATATVNAQPATPDAPTTSVTQPTCSDATATITVTSATDNLMFSFDGGAYGAYPSTGYTTTTTGDHTITAKNEAGCMSGNATATVNAQPGTPDAPTTSVTQPTCSDATATITVTSATDNLMFSFDGGAYGAYPSTGYTTTTTGDHTITAKNEAGCISGSATATVNAQPATPDAPTTSVTQPTCSDATATITVTSATDNLMFSFDGGAYAAYPSTGYTTTTTGDHTITAKNEAGCISGSATATVNAQPATPDAPTTSVTQPTCSDATATITVTSATDNLMFSFDGGAYAAYPSTGYTTTTTGDHTITAKNEAGCISGSATATVNAQPATPDAPTTSVTQPTCSDATATITVTSATTGLTFSFDGGAYGAYPSTGYTTTTTGDHTITAKNEAGCMSGNATATVNAQPGTPDAPTTSVTQPTCSDATATITVTSATDNLMFSFDGGAYGAYPSTGYTTTTTGDHTITAKNEAGCMSGSATATVNAQPAGPSIPSVTVNQPSCSSPSAAITVTSATTGLTFSFDGSAYSAYPSQGYMTSVTGNHTLSAQNNEGCISQTATVTVNAAPACGGILFTYTQGFYHGTGMGCTPSDGSMTAVKVMQSALQNMGGQLYLGAPGASFTVNYADAAELQSILPGGGKAGKLMADYNLNSNYPPLKKGRISNVLLSQTITLALNVNIPNNGLGTFKLQDGYLTTMTKSGSSCTAPAATCENGGSMSSLKITNNTTLMNLLKGKTVNDLLEMASQALGGILPAGVSYDDISAAVDVINQSFDEGRYFVAYNSTQTTCGSTDVSAPLSTTTERQIVTKDQLTVTTNPNPFNDKVTFTINSTVSGNAVLNLYDVMGVKLATIYQGYISSGKRVINYDVPSKFRGTLIYTLTVGNLQTNGKIIRAK